MAKRVSFGMDADGVQALNGFSATLDAQMKTDRHIGPVVKYTHTLMSEEFGFHMDRMAAAAAAGQEDVMDTPFHHVYEWGQIGVPQGRLWTDRLEGHGANRWATFNWRASKKTVPVPSDDLGPNAGEKAFKRIHVFVWKAMVMEFQTQVMIKPKNGKWLGWQSDGPNNIDGLEFSKGPIYIDPGGGSTTGAFTAAYAAWWSGDGAESFFEREVRQKMETDFARGVERHLPKATKNRTKSFSISARGAGGRAGKGEAFNRGRLAAEQFLRANARDYNRAAIARQENLFGGDD